MPGPNRAERRRHGRGADAPPPRRDPMVPIYIGVGVALVVIVLVFLGMNWWQKHQIEQAYATPTPGPNASEKPIQLVDGKTIGVKKWTAKYPDTAQGGRGQTVDGVECGAQEYTAMHVHTHLSIYDNGKQVAIPTFIGFAPEPNTPGGGCLYWIHTHDSSGIIHVEAPQLNPPQGGPYTLGMLFDIWGQPLQPGNVAGITGSVTAFVNGSKYDGDLKSIPLGSHQSIVLDIGSPVAPPPNYAFPPND